jgi:hypothetical protein
MTLKVEQLEALRLGRYEFSIRACEETVLPPFLGTTLRGAFGHALKSITCAMPHGDCSRCLLLERCLYPRLFETASLGTGLLGQHKDAPRPFVFLPPLPRATAPSLRARDDLLRWRVRVARDQRIDFGLCLFGQAVDDLPYVIYAVDRMVQNGFGIDRARFMLEEVSAVQADGKRDIVYTPADRFVRLHNQRQTLASFVSARLDQLSSSTAHNDFHEKSFRTKAMAAGASDQRDQMGSTATSLSAVPQQSTALPAIRLRFLTPTRFRIRGRLVEQPTFTELIRLLSLRLSIMAQVQADAPIQYDYKALLERADAVRATSSTLSLLALERRSNRQNKTLEIDGFTGDIHFVGDRLLEFLPLLLAGEFLHVGSGTAFGLGRYEVVI